MSDARFSSDGLCFAANTFTANTRGLAHTSGLCTCTIWKAATFERLDIENGTYVRFEKTLPS